MKNTALVPRRAKVVWGTLATIALAASMTVMGGSAANAAGSCTSFSVSGSAPSHLVARCQGTVKFTWKCSTDIWGTLQTKTVNYGSSYNTRSHFACNEGHAHSHTVRGV